MSINLGSATAYLEVNSDKFIKGLDEAKYKAQGFSDKTSTAFSKMASAANTLGTAGSKLTRSVTLPIVGIGAAMVKTASDFEQGMANINAVSDMTGKEFETVRQKALELGRTTEWSATQAAGAFELLAKAGWSTEQMLAGVEGTMSLATAGEMDLEAATDLTVSAINQFGLAAEDAGFVADVLAQAANASAIDVADVGEAFKYVGPLAGSLGLSLEEVGGALAIMGQNGIKGSQAGTALNNVLSRMLKPTDEVAKVMEEYNLSLVNADGSMKSMYEIMDMLRSNLSGLTEEQLGQVSVTLAGQRGMAALNSIIGTSAEEYDRLTAAMKDTAGVAQEVAAKKLDSLQGKLKLLKSAVEGAAIAFGNVLVPMVTDLVQKLTLLFEWLGELNPQLQKMIVKIAMVVAAIGPLLLVMSALINSVITCTMAFKSIGSGITSGIKFISGFITVMRSATTVAEANAIATTVSGTAAQTAGMKMGAAATKVLAFAAAHKVATTAMLGVIGILAGLAIAFVKSGMSVDELGNKIIEFIGKAGEMASTIGTVIAGVAQAIVSQMPIILQTLSGVFTSIATTVGQMLPQIMASLMQLLPVLLPTIIQLITNLLLTVIQTITNNLPMIIQTITNIIVLIIQTVSTMLPQFILMVVNILTQIINAIVTNLPMIIQAIVSVINQLVTALVGMLPTLITGATQLFMGIVNSLSSILPVLIEGVLTLILAVISNLVQAIPSLIDAGIQLFMALIEAIPVIIDALIGALPEIITAIIDGLITAIPLLIEAAIQLFMAIVQAIPQIIGALVSALPQIISTIVKALINAAPSIFNAAKTALTSIVKAIPTILGAAFRGIVSVGKNIVKGLWKGISGLKDWVIRKVKGLGKSILNGLADALGISSPSKITTAYGKYLVEGLTKGMKNKAVREDAKKTAKTIGKELTTVMAEAMDVDAVKSSLEKINDALAKHKEKVIDTLKSNKKDYKSEIKALKTTIKEREKAGKSTSEQEKKLKKLEKAQKKNNKALTSAQKKYKATQEKINDYNKKITAQATKMETLSEKIDDAKDKLKTLQEQYDNYASNVQDTFNRLANVTGIEHFEEVVQRIYDADGNWREETVKQYKTAQDFVDQMKDKVRVAQEFQKQIQDLAAKGLNQTAIDQIIALGAEEGTDFAKALLDGLDSESVKSINDSYKAIDNIGASLGGELADKWYGAGVESAKGLLAGLESQYKDLEAYMKKLADALAGQVKKQLKISSPSKVMKALGINTVEGLEEGIDKESKNAVGSMADVIDKLMGAAGNGDLSSALGNTFRSLIDWVGLLDDSLSRTLDMLVDKLSLVSELAVDGGRGNFAIAGSSGKGVNGYGGQVTTNNEGGDTYVFNSPKQMSPEDQARAMRRERRKRELGF